MKYNTSPDMVQEYEAQKLRYPVYVELEEAAKNEYKLFRAGKINRNELFSYDLYHYLRSGEYAQKKMKAIVSARMTADVSEDDKQILEQMKQEIEAARKNDLRESIKKLVRIEVLHIGLRSKSRSDFLQNIRTKMCETRKLADDAGLDGGRLINEEFMTITIWLYFVAKFTQQKKQ